MIGAEVGSGTSAAALLAACGTVQMAVGPSRVFNACNATRGTRRRSEGRALGPSPLFPVSLGPAYEQW